MLSQVRRRDRERWTSVSTTSWLTAARGTGSTSAEDRPRSATPPMALVWP